MPNIFDQTSDGSKFFLQGLRPAHENILEVYGFKTKIFADLNPPQQAGVQRNWEVGERFTFGMKDDDEELMSFTITEIVETTRRRIIFKARLGHSLMNKRLLVGQEYDLVYFNNGRNSTTYVAIPRQ